MSFSLMALLKYIELDCFTNYVYFPSFSFLLMAQRAPPSHLAIAKFSACSVLLIFFFKPLPSYWIDKEILCTACCELFQVALQFHFFNFKTSRKEIKSSGFFFVFMFSKHVLRTNIPSKFFYFFISKTVFKLVLTKYILVYFVLKNQFLKTILKNRFFDWIIALVFGIQGFELID